MDRRSIEWFTCTGCGSPLRVEASSCPENDGTIAAGELICTSCARRFPIVRSIPRFVPGEEYAESFGYQWNRFDRLQLANSLTRFFAWAYFSTVLTCVAHS
jgi:uncharacterized protein YbaR (Trm112 family)